MFLYDFLNMLESGTYVTLVESRPNGDLELLLEGVMDEIPFSYLHWHIKWISVYEEDASAVLRIEIYQ